MSEKNQKLSDLGLALDRESYEWLLNNQWTIADKLTEAVAAGATLDEIKMTAWQHTQRFEIVQRIVNAARYLQSLGLEAG